MHVPAQGDSSVTSDASGAWGSVGDPIVATAVGMQTQGGQVNIANSCSVGSTMDQVLNRCDNMEVSSIINLSGVVISS